MSKIYVLVQDFGYEGLRVSGATTILREAEIWAATGYPQDYVAVETDLLPQPNGFYKTAGEESRQALKETEKK